MAITNPLSITWRGTVVGGSTSYAINGPYVMEKAYDRFLMVFDIVISEDSYANLKTKVDVIEDTFSKRLGAGETLVIDLDGNTWTYTTGQTIFNAEATVTKSGNPDIDRGYARQYTVKIEGELPEDSGGGLREFQVLTSFDISRRRTVTMGGQYFASTGQDATTRYLASFNSVATTYLNFVDSSASWEMVEEGFTIDRNPGDDGLPKPHTCNFSRQYSEIIANQTLGDKDDSQIVDHRITFTDMSVFPVDSREDSQRLRRVAATYECGVQVDQTTDLSTVYEDKIKPLLRQEFTSNYQPQQFVVEDRRVTLDSTNNRISVTVQFVYQGSEAGTLVEVAESVMVRENRTIDYTYLHGKDEFGAIADVGFGQLERVWSRTAIAIGNEAPAYRISPSSASGGGAGTQEIGPWTHSTAGISGPDSGSQGAVQEEGWNIVSSTSQVTPQWMGHSDDQRIELSVLSETVVQRWTQKPAVGTSSPSGPITPGGSSPSGPITPGGSTGQG